MHNIIIILYYIPPHSASYKRSAHLYVCTLVNAWSVEEKHHQCQLLGGGSVVASHLCTLVKR